MKRSHAFLIALAIGVAAVFGLMAATRTTHLGSNPTKATTISSAQIAARNRALDRMEITLRKQLTQKPPALPPMPATAPQQPQQQRVLYVRPAPIVHIVHRHGGEHEAEGADHEGGGFDD
jgi:hypothetical protein